MTRNNNWIVLCLAFSFEWHGFKISGYDFMQWDSKTVSNKYRTVMQSLFYCMIEIRTTNASYNSAESSISFRFLRTHWNFQNTSIQKNKVLCNFFLFRYKTSTSHNKFHRAVLSENLTLSELRHFRFSQRCYWLFQNTAIFTRWATHRIPSTLMEPVGSLPYP